MALKFIDKYEADMDGFIENELKIIDDVTHPNIVRLFELLVDKENYIIVTEIVPGGELWAYVMA